MSSQRVVALSGEIDLYSAPTVCRVLDAIDGAAVVDLSGVKYLSAAGLTELVRVAKRVGNRTVKLVGAPPHVRRVLEIAQFERLFIIE
jgi:anti-anti-sigma factor